MKNSMERLQKTRNRTTICCFSVTKSSLTLCDPVNCSIPCFPVLHYLPEFAQTHAHRVDDANQSFNPLCPLLLLSIFPSMRSFPISHFFPSDGQSIGALASAWALPMNIQDWFLLGLTGLISLLSKGRSRVFSSTTIWKYRIFGTQPSLWCTSHIHTWLLERP